MTAPPIRLSGTNLERAADQLRPGLGHLHSVHEAEKVLLSLDRTPDGFDRKALELLEEDARSVK